MLAKHVILGCIETVSWRMNLNIKNGYITMKNMSLRQLLIVIYFFVRNIGNYLFKAKENGRGRQIQKRDGFIKNE
jgi:hypothetical protein